MFPPAGVLKPSAWIAGKRQKGFPDMRTHVGLGSCNCCDYFLIHEDKVVLVEETQLADTIKAIGKKYSLPC